MPSPGDYSPSFHRAAPVRRFERSASVDSKGLRISTKFCDDLAGDHVVQTVKSPKTHSFAEAFFGQNGRRVSGRLRRRLFDTSGLCQIATASTSLEMPGEGVSCRRGTVAASQHPRLLAAA
jgi:hypothetical protein